MYTNSVLIRILFFDFFCSSLFQADFDGLDLALCLCLNAETEQFWYSSSLSKNIGERFIMAAIVLAVCAMVEVYLIIIRQKPNTSMTAD